MSEEETRSSRELKREEGGLEEEGKEVLSSRPDEREFETFASSRSSSSRFGWDGRVSPSGS